MRKTRKAPRVVKPYCEGRMTEAAFRSFIINRLRGAHWRPKYSAINSRPSKQMVNKKTGRLAKHIRCDISGNFLPQKELQADHIHPMVPTEGFSNETRFLGYNWNDVLRNLFCEKEGYQIISKAIHKEKSKKENAKRKEQKKLKI